MKKSLLGVAIAATLIAACAPEKDAKAGVVVYGSAEQAIAINDSTTDVQGGDNYIGFDATDDFGNGMKGFAKIEMAYDPEGNGLTNRETFVGVDTGAATVKIGRMKNLEKSMVTGNVDIFEGANSFSTEGSARVSNVVSSSVSVSGISLAVASIQDAGGEDVVDAYEAGVALEAMGVKASAVFTKDNATDETRKVIGASLDVAGVGVGLAHQPDADTTTVVGSLDVGSNTVRGGYEMVDGADNTMIAEAVHNFSKTTSAYVNYAKPENGDAETLVGVRVKF